MMKSENNEIKDDVEVDLDISQVSEAELNRLSSINYSKWAEMINSAK